MTLIISKYGATVRVERQPFETEAAAPRFGTPTSNLGFVGCVAVGAGKSSKY